MATEAAGNGGSSAVFDDLTPAQRLQEKHKVDAAHPVTLEDVVDEEDISHPPSSEYSAPKTQSQPVLESAEQPILEKAVKQQADKLDTNALSKGTRQETTATLDTKSEEAFPALGGGPKSQARNPLAMAWGSKKPTSAGHSHLNGINGNRPSSVDASSRASTPGSGIPTPDSANASGPSQNRGLPMPLMPLPGRHSERIQFSPSQLLPRDQLKKPVHDVLRSINKKSKATVQLKSGPNGTIFFEATGPPDATRQALIDVAREVGSKA